MMEFRWVARTLADRKVGVQSTCTARVAIENRGVTLRTTVALMKKMGNDI